MLRTNGLLVLSAGLIWCASALSQSNETRIEPECAPVAHCYKAHSDEEVKAAKTKLRSLITFQSQMYANGTGVFRDTYKIPQAPLMTAGYDSPDSGYDAKLLRTSGKMSSAPTVIDGFSYLQKSCSALIESLNGANLSGLGTYVASVKQMVESSSTKGTVTALKSAFSKVDEVYKKLSEVENDLTLQLEIKSVPTGSSILIASEYQESQKRTEFSGYTDARGINIYRGLYKYTITGDSFEPAHGNLDLIDNPPKVISCSLPASKGKSLKCVTQ